jgi:non-ribosomal peptide synthetase component F
MAHTLLHQIQVVNKSPPNQDGDFIVAVCMKPSDNLLCTLLAIWKAGAAYLPLDPTFPKSRIDHIVNESKPVLVVYDEDGTDGDMFGVEAIKVSTLRTMSASQRNSNIPIDKTLSKGQNDLAIVLYTSGST